MLRRSRCLSTCWSQTAAGATRHTVWNDRSEQTFQLPLRGKAADVENVTIDPDDWILKHVIAASTDTVLSCANTLLHPGQTRDSSSTCSTTTSSRGRRPGHAHHRPVSRSRRSGSLRVAAQLCRHGSDAGGADDSTPGRSGKQHGRVAAGTMVDSDNVLLLRPLRPTRRSRVDDRFAAARHARPGKGVGRRATSCTWQNAALNATGMPSVQRGADHSPEYRLSDSRIRSSVSEDFLSVIVVVNTPGDRRGNLRPLADYIAMVSLARVDPRLRSEQRLRGRSHDPESVRQGLRQRAEEAHELGRGVPERTLQGQRSLMRKRAEIVQSMRDAACALAGRHA